MGLAWPGKVLTWRRNGCCKGNASFSQFMKFPSSRSAHLIPSPNLLNRRGSPAESELYSLLHEMAYSLRLYNTRKYQKKKRDSSYAKKSPLTGELPMYQFLSFVPSKAEIPLYYPCFPAEEEREKDYPTEGKEVRCEWFELFYNHDASVDIRRHKDKEEFPPRLKDWVNQVSSIQ